MAGLGCGVGRGRDAVRARSCDGKELGERGGGVWGWGVSFDLFSIPGMPAAPNGASVRCARTTGTARTPSPSTSAEMRAWLGYDNDSCKNGPFARFDASRREICTFLPPTRGCRSLSTRSDVKNQRVCLECQRNPVFSLPDALGSLRGTGRCAHEMPEIASSLAFWLLSVGPTEIALGRSKPAKWRDCTRIVAIPHVRMSQGDIPVSV